MPVATTPLEMYRGAKTQWQITVTGSSGAGEDMSSGSLLFTVRNAIPSGSVNGDSDSAVVFRLTSASGISVSGCTATLTASKAATCALTLNVEGQSFYYGLEYIPSGDTEPRVLAAGPFKILPDVVRGA